MTSREQDRDVRATHHLFEAASFLRRAPLVLEISFSDISQPPATAFLLRFAVRLVGGVTHPLAMVLTPPFLPSTVTHPGQVTALRITRC